MGLPALLVAAAVPPRTYELLTVIQRSWSSARTAVVPWVPSRTETSLSPAAGLDPDRGRPAGGASNSGGDQRPLRDRRLPARRGPHTTAATTQEAPEDDQAPPQAQEAAP